MVLTSNNPNVSKQSICLNSILQAAVIIESLYLFLYTHRLLNISFERSVLKRVNNNTDFAFFKLKIIRRILLTKTSLINRVD